MNKESAKGLYTYLKDNYGFNMSEDDFYQTMENERERESFRRYLVDNYGFQADGKEFAGMLGINQSPIVRPVEHLQSAHKQATKSRKDAEENTEGQNWLQRRLNVLGNAAMSSVLKVGKQALSLSSLRNDPFHNPLETLNLVTNPKRWWLQQTHSRKELENAADRVEAGTGSEDDKLMSEGVRFIKKVDDLQKEYSNKARQNMGDNADFTSLIRDGQIGDALELGVVTALESTPQMLLGSNPYGRVVLGALSAADEFDRLTREKRDMSTVGMIIQSVTVGVVEQFFESKYNPLKIEGKMARGPIRQQVINWAKRGGKEKLKDVGERFVEWAKDAFGEGIEEFATTIVDDVVKNIIGLFDENADDYKHAYREAKLEAEKNGEKYDVGQFATDVALGVVNDFLGGAATGGIMGGTAHAVNMSANAIEKNYYTDKDGKRHKYTEEQKEELRNHFTDVNIVISEMALDEHLTRKEIMRILDEEQDKLNEEIKSGSEITGKYSHIKKLNEGLGELWLEEDVSEGFRGVVGEANMQVMDIRYQDGLQTIPCRVVVTDMKLNDDGSIDMANSGPVFILDLNTKKPILSDVANPILERVQNELVRQQTLNNATPIESDTQQANEGEAQDITEQTKDESEEVQNANKRVKIDKRVSVQINGKPTDIIVSGRGQIEEDGSIDFSNRANNIILKDGDGKVIYDRSQRLYDSINAALRNPNQSVPQQATIDEEQQAIEAEQQRVEQIYTNLKQRVEQKGFDEINKFKPEEAFIYDMQESGLDTALANVQEKLKVAQQEKNPSTRTAKVKALQSLIDKYQPKDLQEQNKNNNFAEENNNENGTGDNTGTDTESQDGVSGGGIEGQQKTREPIGTGDNGISGNGGNPLGGKPQGNDNSEVQLLGGRILLDDVTISRQNEKNDEVTDLLARHNMQGVTTHRIFQITGSAFRKIIEAEKQKNPKGWIVSEHPLDTNEEGVGYNQCKCYITADGKSGVAVTEDGDIISLFSSSDSKTEGRRMEKLIAWAIANGGRKCDCFANGTDGGLVSLYALFGGKPISQTPFNEEFAPEGWDGESRGPVVTIIFPETAEEAMAACANYKAQGVNRPAVDLSKVPEFLDEEIDGEMHYGYDRAMEYRDKVLSGEIVPRGESNGRYGDVDLSSDDIVIVDKTGRGRLAVAHRNEDGTYTDVLTGKQINVSGKTTRLIAYKDGEPYLLLSTRERSVDENGNVIDQYAHMPNKTIKGVNIHTGEEIELPREELSWDEAGKDMLYTSGSAEMYDSKSLQNAKKKATKLDDAVNFVIYRRIDPKSGKSFVFTFQDYLELGWKGLLEKGHVLTENVLGPGNMFDRSALKQGIKDAISVWNTVVEREGYGENAQKSENPDVKSIIRLLNSVGLEPSLKIAIGTEKLENAGTHKSIGIYVKLANLLNKDNKFGLSYIHNGKTHITKTTVKESGLRDTENLPAASESDIKNLRSIAEEIQVALDDNDTNEVETLRGELNELLSRKSFPENLLNELGLRDEAESNTSEDGNDSAENVEEQTKSGASTKRNATEADIKKLSDLQKELKEAEEEEDFDEVAALNKEITQLRNEVEFSIDGETQGDVEIAGLSELERLQKTLGQFNIITDSRQLPKEEANALRAITDGRNVLGWYNTDTNEVYVYAPNAARTAARKGISIEAQVQETVFHELVAHKGLRQLFGEEKFKQLCHQVWNGMSTNARNRKIAYAYDTASSANRPKGVKGKRFADLSAIDKMTVMMDARMREIAADEYIAELAQQYRSLLETDTSKTATRIRAEWKKVCDWLREAWHRLTNQGNSEPISIDDRQIAKYLQESYERLRLTADERLAAAPSSTVLFNIENENPTWNESISSLEAASHTLMSTGTSDLSKPENAAKIQQISDISNSLSNLIAVIDDGQKLSNKELVTQIALALGIEDASSKYSQYKSVTLGNGAKVNVRISNHQGNAVYFEIKGSKKDVNVGFVIKTNSQRFHPDNNVNYAEFVYFGDKVENDAERQRAIVEGIKSLVETGSLLQVAPADRVNVSGAFKKEEQGLSSLESKDSASRFSIEDDLTPEEQRIREQSQAAGTYMQAPNGEPTRLTEKQWLQVRTEAFKRWFGDWENDPENASKVLDENGEPLVVYRGSKNPNSYILRSAGSIGYYFTPNKEVAKQYVSHQAGKEAEVANMSEEEIDARIQPVFLNIRDMETFDAEGRAWNNLYGETKYQVFDDEGNFRAFDTEAEASEYAQSIGLEADDYYPWNGSTDEVFLQRKQQGRTGMQFHNVIDGADIPSDVYVVAENTQAKSATLNNGEFDDTNPDIRFQIEDDEPITNPDPSDISERAKKRMEKKAERIRKLNANLSTTPAQRLTGAAKLIYETQDNTWGIKILMDKINLWRKQHGKSPIPESQDVRSLLNRMSSSIASRFELFKQRERSRLDTTAESMQEKLKKQSSFLERFKEDHLIEEDAKGNKFHYEPTVEDLLERYLIAKDNIERAEMREAGHDIAPRGEREFTMRMGVSMVEYVEIFENMFSEEELNDLWDAIRGCTNLSIRTLKDSGRISQDEYDRLAERKFYVPEKDYAERNTNKDLGEQKEEQQSKRRGGRKNLAASAIAHKAKGGDSMATDILANIIHDVQNSIAVSEENKVRRAMFDLMQDNQDYAEQYGVPLPKQEWFVKIGERKDGSPIYERSLEQPDSELLEEAKETNAIIKQMNGIIKELRETLKIQKKGTNEYNETKEQLTKALDYKNQLRNSLPIVTSLSKDNRNIVDERSDIPTVTTYIDGVRYNMTFDGMQEVADALNGVFDLRDGMETAKLFNKIMASIFTTYNPTFFAVNLARDIPYVLAKGGSEYGVEFMARYVKALGIDLKSTNKPILQYLAGKLDDSTPEGKLFYNFLMGGGNTGYSQVQSVRSIREEFNKTKIGRNLFEYGAKLNEYSELVTRFAAYKAMLECGYSENEALNAAKNLSTNFNMRGAGNKFINAFNSLSMFTNAAIQGAAGFYKTFNTPQKATRAFFLMCFGPAFMGFLNTLLCPDDDDEEYKVADYYRDNYLVLGSIKIPITQELRPFWRIGVNIALQMQGRRNVGQATESIITGFTEYLLPLPPIITSALVKAEEMVANENTGEGVVQNFGDIISSLIIPQFAEGVKELSANKDFMGNTIRKDYEWSDTPQFQLNQNEAELYKDISKLFYGIAGGDVKHPSKYNRKKDAPIGERIALNISPKEVHKVAGTIVSNGWLQVFCSLYGIGKAVYSKDETLKTTIKSKDIPLYGTFVRPEQKTMYRYSIYKEANQLLKDYNNVLKSFKDDISNAKSEYERKELEHQRDAWVKNQRNRGFDPKAVKAMIDEYKKSNAYTISMRLGEDEEEIRKKHPEWEMQQKRSVEAMNEMLMDYKGIEHHLTWLERILGHKQPAKTKQLYIKKKKKKTK